MKHMSRSLIPLVLCIYAILPMRADAQAFRPGENIASFTNGGERLSARVFLPASYRAGQELPTVVVTGAWLTVKEQMPAVYAKRLAAAGFAVVTFDFRTWGESEGWPRQLESARLKVSDLHAVSAFAKSLPFAGGKAPGLLSICFSVGYGAKAIAEGADFRAFATVAAWIHDRPSLEAVFGTAEVERRYGTASAARDALSREGIVHYVPAHSATDRTAAMNGLDYYSRSERGVVPAWTNRMAVVSWTEWLDLAPVTFASRVNIPTLVVHSDHSALPDRARAFHEALGGPKALVWLEGEHTQFYDSDPQVMQAAAAVGKHFLKFLD
jgi:uncharacterized protein